MGPSYHPHTRSDARAKLAMDLTSNIGSNHRQDVLLLAISKRRQSGRPRELADETEATVHLGDCGRSRCIENGNTVGCHVQFWTSSVINARIIDQPRPLRRLQLHHVLVNTNTCSCHHSIEFVWYTTSIAMRSKDELCRTIVFPEGVDADVELNTQRCLPVMPVRS